MALFQTDSIALCYADLDAAKEWWIRTFECKVAKGVANWDDPLPSDVALLLPGDSGPTIVLCDRAESEQAGFDRTNGRSVIFSNKIKKAHEELSGKGVAAGPIQDGGDVRFFELRDLEGNVIEICTEP